MAKDPVEPHINATTFHYLPDKDLQDNSNILLKNIPYIQLRVVQINKQLAMLPENTTDDTCARPNGKATHKPIIKTERGNSKPEVISIAIVDLDSSDSSLD